jgi:hypothetical protein
MLFVYLLFFVDFLAYILLNGQFVYLLLIYFIASQLDGDLKQDYMPLFFLLLQDNFLNERFGLNLIFLMPILLFAAKARNWFGSVAKVMVFPIFLLFSIFLNDFLIKKWLLGQNITFYSTLSKFLINIIIGYLIFLGTRGNRSFLSISK